MTIDPNSPTYLFSKILTEIEQLKTRELEALKNQLREGLQNIKETELKDLKGQLNNLDTQQINISTLLNNLPCERDDIRIKNLEKKLLLQNGATGSKPLHRLLAPALTTGNIGFLLLVLYVIAKAEGWLP